MSNVSFQPESFLKLCGALACWKQKQLKLSLSSPTLVQRVITYTTGGSADGLCPALTFETLRFFTIAATFIFITDLQHNIKVFIIFLINCLVHKV